MFKIIIAVLFVLSCRDIHSQNMNSTTGFSDKDEKLDSLQLNLNAVEAELINLQQQLKKLKFYNQDTADVDTQLVKQLSKEPGSTSSQKNPQHQPAQKILSAHNRLFQGMNPNISVVGTVLGNASSQDELERHYDLQLSESEFVFQAAVDPFAKADFYIAFGRENEPVLSPPDNRKMATNNDEAEEGGLNPEIEEAYVTFLSLPFSSKLKAGKFRTTFGKLNETHPHAYNILDLPLMYQSFLGPDGLVDEGLSLNWLLPHSAFFQELKVQILRGPSESPSFIKADNDNFLYLTHLKNFFDLNDNTTLEVGMMAATGPHSSDGDRTNFFGGDLTFKWKPLRRNTYRSFEWTNEFLYSSRDAFNGKTNSLGFFSHLRYQTAKRWFFGGLAEYSEFPEFSEFHRKAFSGILQFLVTEFQKIEIQTQFNTGNFFDDFVEIKLRSVFVIGAHGAHRY